MQQLSHPTFIRQQQPPIITSQEQIKGNFEFLLFNSPCAYLFLETAIRTLYLAIMRVMQIAFIS